MMIFKKALPRRTLLRGLGASLALPLLDAMIPAFANAAQKQLPTRLGIVYSPNGMWPMDKWTPKAVGAAFELTPTLEPLTPFRDQFLVLSGLAQKQAFPVPGEGAVDHTNAMTTFLTGVRAKATAGKDFRAGISMDQIAAQSLGKDTQLASLEVSLFVNDLVGVCEGGYTCAYLSTLSWRTATTPLPTEHSPHGLFERLFGDSDSTERTERLAIIRSNRSILDEVTRDATMFMTRLGPGDRGKIAEYLDAIRDIERRIQIADAQSDRELPNVERPVGIPDTFDEYAKLMVDLQVLAFQADLTRVLTFTLGHEGPNGGRAYPEIGIADLHHTLSHHQNNLAAIDKLQQINVYHTSLFAYFLEKLRSTSDSGGRLLDSSILLYGSGLSNGNIHQHDNLPLILAGGAGGRIKGGRHLRYPDGTPMTNLHMTLLDMLGVPVESLGDSTGRINL